MEGFVIIIVIINLDLVGLVFFIKRGIFARITFSFVCFLVQSARFCATAPNTTCMTLITGSSGSNPPPLAHTYAHWILLTPSNLAESTGDYRVHNFHFLIALCKKKCQIKTAGPAEWRAGIERLSCRH